MLTYSELRFSCRLATPHHGLRYIGSTLRGALGPEFEDGVRQAAGLPKENGQGTSMPQPFTLVVAPPSQWDGGPDEVRFGIRLFGPATAAAAHLVEAVHAMGDRGLGGRRIRARLESVTDGNHGPVLWQPGDGNLAAPTIRPVLAEQHPALAAGPIRWNFHTPLSLRQVEAIAVKGIHLTLAGRRRWRLMNQLYGDGGELPPDPWLDSNAFRTVSSDLDWWEVGRQPGRIDTMGRQSGVLGTMVIDGPWDLAGDWTRAADIIQLGKYTSSGFGRVSWAPT